jgi:hypothetical protein
MAGIVQAEAVYRYHSSLTVLQYCALSVLMGAGMVVIVMMNQLQRPGMLRVMQMQGLVWFMLYFFRMLIPSFCFPAKFPMREGLMSAGGIGLFIGAIFLVIGIFFSLFERPQEAGPEAGKVRNYREFE